MKTVTSATRNNITNDHHNVVGTVMHAEWNLNRFYKAVADNTPSEDTDGYDVDMFPIESIVKENRPEKSGICKAVIGQSRVSPLKQASIPRVRYYMADDEDQYKYWQSPVPSSANGAMTKCAPQILYYDDSEGNTAISVSTNKIIYTVENSYAAPGNYTVQVKATPSSAWTTIATNVLVPDSGRVELWWNGTAWTTTKTLGFVTQVHGIRLSVASMVIPSATTNATFLRTRGSKYLEVTPVGVIGKKHIGAVVSLAGVPVGTTITSVKDMSRTTTKSVNGRNVKSTSYYTQVGINNAAASAGTSGGSVSTGNQNAFFNLIELAAMLERDLTPDLVSWSDDFNLGEEDFITPLGQISTNTGTVTLFNENGLYTNTNEVSPLHNLLDKGVRIRCWTKYGAELIPEFEMYSDVWSETIDQTTISLVDGAAFFMEVKPPAVLYQNIPVQEAVWRVCDTIGFSNYEVVKGDLTDSVIDIFWTDGEKTAWEVFGELSRATQTAIYLDHRGVLKIVTRDAAWRNTTTSDFTLLGESVPGGQPSNIVELTEETKYEANKVKVNWQPTMFSEPNGTIYPFEKVWESSGTTTLRSTPLRESLSATDMVIKLETKAGKTWPYSGYMTIDGEMIRYDASQYMYYNAANQRQYAWVSSAEDKAKFDDRTNPTHRHMNSFVGNLRVGERGYAGTNPEPHRVDMNHWQKIRRVKFTTRKNNPAGITLNKGKGTVTIDASYKGVHSNDFTFLKYGRAQDEGYRYLGCRMKIDKSSHTLKTGGIFFNTPANSMGAGYFLEISASVTLDGAQRSSRNEIRLISRKPNGSSKVFGGQTIKTPNKAKGAPKGSTIKQDIGATLAVVQDVYIDFDIRIKNEGAGHRIIVNANGGYLFEALIPNGEWKHGNTGAMGGFARGNSKVTFEYVYGMWHPTKEVIDSESYWNRVTGGYASRQLEEFIYDTRSVRKRIRPGAKKTTKIKQRYNQKFVEEFGPVAHEVRNWDVKYSGETPVLEAKLYSSNEDCSAVGAFFSGIKGAKFSMFNTSRRDAILNGTDPVTRINHQLFVWGRPVLRKTQQTIEVVDEWARRRRGEIEVEYASPWIQNEAEAKAFANWLKTNWSRSGAKVTTEVFGNPLIEPCDVVRVRYRHIDALFWVVGVANSFDSGLTTQLTLRRIGI